MFAPRNRNAAQDALNAMPELASEQVAVSKMYRIIGPQLPGYSEAAKAFNAKVRAAGLPSVLLMSEG